MKVQNFRYGLAPLALNFTRMILFSLCALCSFTAANFGQGGILDPTFRNGVVATPNNALGSRGADSVMQADGKIVVLMHATSPGTTMRNSIVRLNQDGSVDTGFGVGGFRDVVWSAPNQGIAGTIAIQIVQTPNGPEERFVIAGNFATGPNTSYFRIERYTNAGSPDTSFGVNGVTALNLSLGLCNSTVQPFDQKILIASGEVLLRLNVNGTPDTTFGPGGVSPAKHGISLKDLDVLPDGRILGTGSVSQGKSGLAIARFNSNGSLDDGGRSDSTRGDSFGTGGKTIVSVGTGDVGLASVVDPFTGAIYMVGESQIGGTTVQKYDAVLTRFNALGQLDKTFGSNGVAILNIANLQDEFTSVVLFNDKIIVAGEGRSGTNNADYLIARYNLNGTLDPTFGDGGRLLYNFLNDYDHAFDLFIQPDPACGGCPKLIVTGLAMTGLPSSSPSYAGVLRFLL